jgi:hypothetical protein
MVARRPRAHLTARSRDRRRAPQIDRIVGRAIFPNFGQGSFTPTDLGEGAETTTAGLGQQAAPPGGPAGYEFVLLRFARGPQRAARIAAFQRSMSGICRAAQDPR